MSNQISNKLTIMRKKMLICLFATGVAACTMYSCQKETPAPQAEIFASIDGYQVTFSPQVTDASTYSWDFGDGSALVTDLNPVHIYESFGDYPVTLTVKGDGGQTTVCKTVTIAATSIKDLLTGGIKASNGKTWILSTAYVPGKDGGGPVLNALPVNLPSTENVLTMFGLGAEYDNEYTFYFDGKYKMDLKNGKALAGAVYGVATQTVVGSPSYDVGLCAASYTVPTNSTWTAHTENFVVDAITDPNTTAIPPVHGNVNFSEKKWISFSSGAFFGILDFPSTPKIVIKEISPDKMNVAIFLCGYGYSEAYVTLPTNILHLTFIKKP